MLEKCSDKLSSFETPIKLINDDVTTQTFSKKFTHTLVSFGIRNIPNRESALCNIRKHTVSPSTDETCTEPGRLGILEVSYKPTFVSDVTVESLGFTTPLKLLTSYFIHYLVPSIAYVANGFKNYEQYVHLVDSLESFPKDFEREVGGLECEGGGRWRVEEVEERNFGSIKVYTFVAV